MWRRPKREELIDAATVLASSLAKRGAQQVILFGSLARQEGSVGVDSDVDMVVVMPGIEGVRFHKRLADLPEIEAFPYPLDLLVYSPEEWERVRRRWFFNKEVEEKGTVLV